MLAKLQMLPEVVTARMWLQVRAIDKGTAHLARPRIWATGQHLERLGRCRHHWAWACTFFAVVCAAVFALRVDDIGSFTWDGIATPRFITFWEQKANAEWVTVPLSPYLERWSEYLHQFRRPNQLPTTPLFPGDGLAARCLQDLVEGTPAPTSNDTRGSGSQQQRTCGLGAPLWASNSGPSGGRPDRPATTPATPQPGRSRTPCACPSLPDSLAHQHETSTMASSLPRIYGREKLGHLSPPGRPAGLPHLHTSSTTHISTTTTRLAQGKSRWTSPRSLTRTLKSSPKQVHRRQMQRRQTRAEQRAQGKVMHHRMTLMNHSLMPRHAVVTARRCLHHYLRPLAAVSRTGATSKLQLFSARKWTSSLLMSKMIQVQIAHITLQGPGLQHLPLPQLQHQPSNPMWSAACFAPQSLQSLPAVPSARVHRGDKPRRALLARYHPLALTRCPSTTGKRGKALRASRTKPSRALTASGGTPTSQHRCPERASSSAQHPAPRPRPITAPQHRQQVWPPVQSMMAQQDQNSGRTSPQVKPQPRTEKCDRFCRKMHAPSSPPMQTGHTVKLTHGQTMPHFGATTSSRLGKGHATCNGTQDPCHCHK